MPPLLDTSGTEALHFGIVGKALEILASYSNSWREEDFQGFSTLTFSFTTVSYVN